VSTADALGKYEVIGKLAETAAAELYVARTQSSDAPTRFVVIKRLRREVAADVDRVRTFLVRTRLAARIEHQNVAQVVEVGKLGGSYFCAMEYVDGEPVRAIIEHARAKKVPIPVRVVLAIAAGATMGLRTAHECKGEDGKVLGVVHGDITPSSVMVSRTGLVKLVGFGLAPDAANADRKTDLHGLGAMLWELLTLHPFEGNGAAASVSSKRLDVPKELDAIVMKLLATGTGERYDYAGEALADIEALAARLDIAISAQDLARAMRLWFPEPVTGGGELQAVMIEAEQAPRTPVALDGGATGIDTALEEIRTNTAAIRAAVAAAAAQPTGRRRASSAVQPLMPVSGGERESFEQIRDRIMANARPKTGANPVVPAAAAAAPAAEAAPAERKKSETLNPNANPYSYITSVAGKETEPLRVATAEPAPTAVAKIGLVSKPANRVGEIIERHAPSATPPPEVADTEKMDSAARAEIEQRAREHAEEALRAEEAQRAEAKKKVLAEQRAKAEALAAQERARAEKAAGGEAAAGRAKTATGDEHAAAEVAAGARIAVARTRSEEVADDEDKQLLAEARKAKEVAKAKEAENGDEAKADEAKAEAAKADTLIDAKADTILDASAEAKAASAKARAKSDSEAKPSSKSDTGEARAKRASAREAAHKADAREAAYDDGDEGKAKPKWLVPAAVGGVAVIGILIFVMTRGGGQKEPPQPPPAPPPRAAVIADAAIKVAATVPPDAAEVVAAPPDAAEVAAAPVDAAPPPDAPKVAAVTPDAGAKHHDTQTHDTQTHDTQTHDTQTHDTQTHETHEPVHHDEPKPKPPAEDKRTIEELFGAGELAKVNKACASATRFNSQILLDCGLAACTAKDAALAKRWSNALSGQARNDVVAKCHDAGIDL
jgi:serine/threonine-protein kinase